MKVGSLAAAVGRLAKDLADALKKREEQNRELLAALADVQADLDEFRKLRQKWEPVINKFMNGPGKLFLKG